MPTESVSLSLLSVVSLLSFFVALTVNKFSTKIGNSKCAKFVKNITNAGQCPRKNDEKTGMFFLGLSRAF